MKSLFFALILLITAACHKKTEVQPIANTLESKNDIINPETDKLKNSQKKDLIPRHLRAAIYFAASLERESLRLIFKNDELQKTTLFSVLSYALESKAGSKKSTPRGLDCSKIELIQNGLTFVFMKSCRQPAQEIAYLREVIKDKEYEISFVIDHWASVMGMSAVITGSNITCKITLENEKLSVLKCNNWSYQISEDQISATVARADDFEFNRNSEQQLILKGGFYRELVKNKNFNITVPLHGKIKIIEKEIKVIDEFSAFKDGVTDEEKNKESIKENKSNEENDAVKIGEVKEAGEAKVEEKDGQKNGEIGDQSSGQEDKSSPQIESEGVSETQQIETPRRGR